MSRDIKPFRFSENRVWRVYKGGKQIDILRGKKKCEDTLFPEDWVASVVRANNPQRENIYEGISTALIEGESVRFDVLIESYAEQLLGEEHVKRFGKNPGFLTKLLDSAIRLPLQAHPDVLAAKRFYNSRYGKTEAWIILGTRSINGEKPHLILGFNGKFNREVFIEEALSGFMPRSLEMVHRYEVNPGEIIMLPGGLVHAIGSGVFMIEIMEPTDLVVQPEAKCGDQDLTIGDRFGSIDPVKAMNVFHFNAESKDNIRRRCFLSPTCKEKNEGYEYTVLIDRNKIGFFGAEKINVNSEFIMIETEEIFRVGIVTEGTVELLSDLNETLKLKQGDTFFIPASVKKWTLKGGGQIIFTLPPVSSGDYKQGKGSEIYEKI